MLTYLKPSSVRIPLLYSFTIHFLLKKCIFSQWFDVVYKPAFVLEKSMEIQAFIHHFQKNMMSRIQLAMEMVCKSNRNAMNRNWSNQKTNSAPKTKTGNK